MHGQTLDLGTAVLKNPALFGFRVLGRADLQVRKNSSVRDHGGTPGTC